MYANIRGQLTREYKSISENPPPYITAHPSEANILEYVAPHFCGFRTDSDIEAQMALYNYWP
jgi:ubiquitin-protein ligase